MRFTLVPAALLGFLLPFEVGNETVVVHQLPQACTGHIVVWVDNLEVLQDEVGCP